MRLSPPNLYLGRVPREYCFTGMSAGGDSNRSWVWRELNGHSTGEQSLSIRLLAATPQR